MSKQERVRAAVHGEIGDLSPSSYADPEMDTRGTSRRFSIRLEGGPAREARAPLSELVRVGQSVHRLLRDVATVLTRETSGRPGRVRRFVEQATELDVVAEPRAGSLVLDLELPPEPPRLDEALEGFDPGPDLGEEALDCLITGLPTIKPDTDTLPRGFDRGVLRDMVRLRPSFRKGISAVVLERDGGRQERVSIDTDRLNSAQRLMREPVKGPAVAEGKLEMVDRTNLVCRIDRPERAGIACAFPHEMREKVTTAIGRHVRVTGEGTFQPGSDDPDRIEADSLASLYEELQFDATAFSRTLTIDELAEEQGVTSSDELISLGPLEWLDDAEAESLKQAAQPGGG